MARLIGIIIHLPTCPCCVHACKDIYNLTLRITETFTSQQHHLFDYLSILVLFGPFCPWEQFHNENQYGIANNINKRTLSRIKGLTYMVAVSLKPTHNTDALLFQHTCSIIYGFSQTCTNTLFICTLAISSYTLAAGSIAMRVLKIVLRFSHR